MDANGVPQAARARPWLNAYTKALRREPIFSQLRLGWSYAAIAREEGLSEQRVRQIVADALKRQRVDSERDHAPLQLVRLEGAHALAAESVSAGDIKAIAPYLKVLERLDRYQKPERSTSTTPPHGKDCSPSSTASSPDWRPPRLPNRPDRPPPGPRPRRLRG
jgi:hypothetical protein